MASRKLELHDFGLESIHHPNHAFQRGERESMFVLY
jgi:hypothetical protein